MATEITCVDSVRSDPSRRIERLGGPGWTQDEATVIGQIEAGWRYFVGIGPTRVNVVLIESGARRYLRTDPEETAANDLLSLPPCTCLRSA